MAGRTSLMADKALNLYNGLSPSPPLEMYVSLFTTAPVVDSPIAAEHQAVEWGPARVQIFANSSANSPRWSLPTADNSQRQKISNIGSIQWPSVTLGVSPSIVIAAGVFDALTGGNLLTWDYLVDPVTVSDGQSYVLGTGEFIIKGD